MPMNWLRGKVVNEVGTTTPAAPAQPAQALPAAGAPAAVWADAACKAMDKGRATESAQHVAGDALLAEVATRCRFAEVRLATARRIVDPAVLKRVAQASREKDKHVYRHCTDTLKETRMEGERARRSVGLAASVRALLEVTPVAISHLLQIEKDLAALGLGGEETKECEALLEEARARVLGEAQAQIELNALLVSAEAMSAAIEGVQAPDSGQLESWSADHSVLAETAAATPGWLKALPAGRALEKVLDAIELRVIAHVEAIEHAAHEAAERIAATEAKQAAEVAAKLAAEQAPPVEKAKAKPVARKTIDHEALQKRVDALEAHLESGRLIEAEAVTKAIDHALGGAVPSGQLARRLQRARSQEARLVGWARWGTDQAREQLIGAAEALLRGEPDVAERAKAVPLLRREWKDLDVHGGAPQALWKRFDRALERAYKPVAEQRAVEAAAQEAARAAKAALCEAWEGWLAQASPADVKAMEAKREEVTGQWRAAARAGFGDERKLRKRFDAIVEKLDAGLEEVRGKELARRKDLVAQAEALKETPDLAAAMSAAKTLQRRWKDEMVPVSLRHGVDHKVWQRFRAACDVVFARRDAEQADAQAERAMRDEARRAEMEAARLVESAKREKHAARFAVMAEKAAVVPDAAPDVLARGLVERDEILLDLEIALELPTPDSHAAARRARNLARLQDRFRKGTAAPLDPEALVAKWYAVAATPDEGQAARMAAVVSQLLKGQARRDSRS